MIFLVAQTGSNICEPSQVVTIDGRELTGTFNCLDHLGNILLFDTFERYKSGDVLKERPLHAVIVPQARIQSAKVLVEADDKVLKILLTDDAMAGINL